MGWCHPEISMEALLKLIKGFVDIMILASGYQSSGSTASWDSQNIKKALQWGIFFENVFEGLHSSDDYEGSIMELDAALLEMTSNPYFPKGLTNLSSETLTRGRDFVLKHLIHTLPLSDAHLTSLLTAAVEMDLDALRATEYDCLSVYLEKLMLQNPNPDSPPQAVQNIETEKSVCHNHSEFIIQELSKRQAFVSCVSSVETNLSILSKSLTCGKWDGSSSTMLDMRSHDVISILREDQLVELEAWKKWRSRTISYLLDKRTVKLVSGAKLIFSAPKVQWFQMFERLRTANGGGDLLEIIELFLLGCISSNWSRLIEHFMSVSYDPLPISKQYYEVHNLLQGRSQCQHPKVDTMNPQENDIVEYLAVLLRDQQHLLWKLSPILVAAAIPSWSPLFKLYFIGVERLFSGYPFIIRCCSCIQDCREHKDCELAERIRCLYIFHAQGSHLMADTSSS